MAQSHAEIARQLTAKLPTGVFAHGARDAVIYGDFTMLERMFPGMRFACRKDGVDQWELVGICEDGSVVVWRVGG
jgi:hypothetical protein